ncbi:hypothetical protein B0H14DRAFT_3498028 [Mycena olivaceomarginata]|nr:hypothetical protein B0H14DRAFT_3498028 [Mycena olivaceomarginata]
MPDPSKAEALLLRRLRVLCVRLEVFRFLVPHIGSAYLLAASYMLEIYSLESGELAEGVTLAATVPPLPRSPIGSGRKAKTGTSGVVLVSTGDAESLDAEVAVEVPADAEAIPEGENKRKRRPNTRYADFWRHANDIDEDLILPGI